MNLQPRWHLRSSLTLLLVAASGITLLLAFTLLLAYYQPRLAEQTRSELGARSNDLAHRSERVLSLLQGQLELLAGSWPNGSDRIQRQQLTSLIGKGAFSAVYHIASNGRVTHAAVSRDSQKQVAGLIDFDLSNDRLRRLVMERQHTVWSDKYLSPVFQRPAVAIGVWTGQGVIVGEIPFAYILETVTDKSNPAAWSIWVTDGFGNILADSERSERIGVVNIAKLPIFSQIQGEARIQEDVHFEGRTYDMALSQSAKLNWNFIVGSQTGLASPPLQTALSLGLTATFSLMLLTLIFAPIWAARTARPINAIAERARQLAEGDAGGEWPHSTVIELNQLSCNLAHMSESIQERERELQAIFDCSPAGMIVADMYRHGRFTRANDAILEIFGYSREEILTLTGQTLRVWKNPENRKQFIAQLQAASYAHMEAWMCQKDGTEFLADLSARLIDMGGASYVIWVVENITEYRRIEHEVRELNVELEDRVQKRTDQLSKANAELSTSIEHLQLAQNELVRSEKLASLGAMVAGVAHELNTPIGNCVMAISTLRTSLKCFRSDIEKGLKRSVLDRFLDSVDTGSVITERNLERAADLVTSFKQVAVDQTSSQRRSFKLDEVVREIALTLGPTLRNGVAELDIDVPSSIAMESYPGPLGQIITNLISNATVHAFPDREHGTISIHAETDNGLLRLCISDDGVGIPPDLLPRIFDPFVTSKMGRGGTGLGLHIAHNIAAQILGGNVFVSSSDAGGTTFELNIPLVAPLPESTAS